ncbi:hypothetical protein K461DRAFT_272629 [Myriangium duriaei CBS 260.36]|uniref:Uncharacterized protein n=1 Tax=Myriangium duriaei CBS 260.36 TaxID=1168546 RepID=A0A9P4MKR4_9PEZI|nr:hypothetical protein K461DRAFT_272629 [Myriangium duriaei CBS 260.36]
MDPDTPSHQPTLTTKRSADTSVHSQTEATRSRGLIEDWAKNAKSFTDFDLSNRLDVEQSNQPLHTMSDQDPPLSTNPEDFDYIITTNDDEDFETVEASPHFPSSAVASVDTDTESISESGETVETVSACGHSDGETVASVNSELEDVQDNPNASFRFPDPIAPPTEASQTLPETAALLEHDLPPRSVDDFSGLDKDDDWSAIRDSEITIRGLTTDIDTPKLEQSSAELGNETRGVSLNLPQDTSQNKADSVGKHKVKLNLASYAGPVVGIVLWLFCMATLSVKFELYQLLTGSHPLEPHVEMRLRHNTLDEILLSKGLVDSAGTAITAQHVLQYPSVFVPPAENPQITFPTEIAADIIDNNKLFISLPKEASGRNYLSRPEVRILEAKCSLISQERCEISILKQEDLIQGLTFILLDMPKKIRFFRIHIQSEQHVKVIRAGVPIEKPVMNPVHFGGSRAATRKKILDEFQGVLSFFVDESVKVDHAIRRFVSKKNKEYMKAGKLLPTQALRLRAKRAFRMSVGRVHGVHQNVAPLLLQIKATKRSLSEKMVNGVPSKMTSVGRQTGAVLFRAQRNGLGIARRMVRALRLA